MSNFWTIAILAVLAAGCVGYRISCNDLLQQSFNARKLTLRVSEFLTAVLVELVLWLTSESVLARLVPFAVFLVCGIVCWCMMHLWKKKNDENDLQETGLRTTVSMCISEFIALLVCLLMPSWGIADSLFQAGEAELAVCKMLLLSIGAVTIFILVVYIQFIRNSTDDGATTRASASFRKRVKRPFFI
ncbi:MAG: hypothetical protein IKB09_10770 [Oscillospiraceae bacterium]|nr:hypothetical protein [Oscillospiraceae bacterium]